MFDVSTIRKDFPILKTTHNGKSLVYFDNAATSQKPTQVVDMLNDYYLHNNSNIHRGAHFLGERATDLYEQARKTVQRFLHASSSKEIIFTRSTTESINLLAHSYVSHNLSEGDVIVVSKMEHHGNLVPWLMLAASMGLKIEYIEVDASGRLILDNLDEVFHDKVKFLSITHVSNVLGTVNPVKEIVAHAKSKGIVTCVDASQSAPHMKLDVQDIDCDFLAFTGHKICGPTGIGVLYGKQAFLEKMPPFFGGGGMIQEVFLDHFIPADIPERFEAGTPNIAGAIGLGAAIEYLEGVSFESFEQYEQELCRYLMESLKRLDWITLYGSDTCEDRVAIVSFSIDGVHPHDVSDILSEEAICVRAGHHCAQPLMRELNVSATTRASLYFYNTREEIDAFIQGLEKVYSVFNA